MGIGWHKQHERAHYDKPISYGPNQAGFDYFYGIAASLDMPPYCFIENDRVVEVPSVPKHPIHYGQEHRGGLMAPGWKDEAVNQTLTEKAIRFIEEQTGADADKPFFLYVPLTGPHTPWVTSEAFKGRSGIGPRGDVITELDWTVGEMMAVLERQGVADHTLIMGW